MITKAQIQVFHTLQTRAQESRLLTETLTAV